MAAIYIFLKFQNALSTMALNIYSSVTCAFPERHIPNSCALSWNETFINFTVENDHQISEFKSIFVKHFNKQILHGYGYLDFLEQEAQQCIPRRGQTEGVARPPSWLNWRNASSHANNIQIVFTGRHDFCCVDKLWGSKALNYQNWHNLSWS